MMDGFSYAELLLQVKSYKHALDNLRDQLNLCRTKLVVPIVDELTEIEKVETILGEN